jgi:hypothetical protein
MEQRFGLDFSAVRIHADRPAAELSGQLQARAFTAGNHIYFNRGQYRPDQPEGRRLLAHELAHTAQQGAVGTAASGFGPPIQRAVFSYGGQDITIDYSEVVLIPEADRVAAIEGRYIAFTGAADASIIAPDLAALSATAARWVLLAVDLLVDNTRSPDQDSLDRREAVKRLIRHAPNAQHVLLDGSPVGRDNPAEVEALRVSGWLEAALPASHRGPTARDRDRIQDILNPPPAGAPGDPLVMPDFRDRLDAGLRHLLRQLDPSRIANVGTRDLPTLQGIGDIIMDRARRYYSPHAGAGRGSVLALNPPFHISANIFSVTTRSYSQDDRMGYLRNRAQIVGRNDDATEWWAIDADIFRDTNFDSRRDEAEMEAVLAAIEADPAMQPIVENLLKHTGQQEGSGASTRIGLSTEFNAGRRSECEARWQVIATLCHEVLHALAHPDFEAAAAGHSFGQVMIEGFTEVLGVELFNRDVKPTALADPAFRASMELGLTGAPCTGTPIADDTVGYGAAGAGAAEILARPSISADDFRSAYFLGRTDLIGF